MGKTLYTITLTEEEKQQLHSLIETGEESERTILRAKILLLSDTSNLVKYTVSKLAEELGTTNTTIQTTRTEYGQGGVDVAVFRKKRVVPEGGYKFNDEVISKIKNLYESTPPEGKKRWSTRLLCKVCMEQGIVEHIAPSSMSALLRKIKNELN